MLDELVDGKPSQVRIAELFAGKKGVLFGVPGAFTPGCSKTHLPGYVADAEALRSAGAEVVVCVSVNDTFVMGAWGDAHGAAGKVRASVGWVHLCGCGVGGFTRARTSAGVK